MPPPKKLGKYRILEELGRGGFAAVYKAHDPSLNRDVALKVLHPYWSNDPGFVTRFQREAQAAAGLHHPHIVPVYETGGVEGQLYIAMAYLPGRTLRDLLAAESALPLGRAIPILSQVAEALDYARGRGIVHRDVKPANVIVQERGEKVNATLLDFGLVKAAEGSSVLTSQGTLLGSPEYMAPEQADPERAAEVGPAADRYALGVMAYHMLTGRVPFPGNTPGTLNAHEHKPVPPPRSLRPDLPEPVAQALLKMLAKAPAERYPSACQFVEQLDQAWQAECQARQREAQLAPLYQQLQAAVGREDWAEALELGGQIRALDPNYREVSDLMIRARRQLQPPRSGRIKPSTPRRAPRWVWALGGVGLAIVLALFLSLVLDLWPGPQSTPTHTAELPTATTPSVSATMLVDTATPQPPASVPAPGLGATRTRPADGMPMVYVPAGTFQMGSAEGEPNADGDEKPQHQVTLDAFWIDKYEVSNALYTRCVEAGACQESAFADDPTYNGADYPVVGVSWQDAVDYCQWIGGRLPTEAEWEYAARGPHDGRIYPWGDDPPTCERSQFWGCSEESTLAVGSLPEGASWCGVHDLAGNVWEWVNDWYRSDYYASSPPQNPKGPETGDTKVLRGGSWNFNEEYVRAANRNHNQPAIRVNHFGFRCVVEPGS
jgi:serine/threonine-protein kinase